MKPVVLLIALFFPFMVIAQWTSLNGPPGGFINHVTEIKNDIWLCTVNGLFKSSDNGSHWMHDSRFNDFSNVLFAAQFSDTIIICCLNTKTEDSNVFYSVNNGNDWHAVGSAPPPDIPVKIYKVNNRIIGLSNYSSTGVYVIENFSDNWIYQPVFGNNVGNISGDSSHLVGKNNNSLIITENPFDNWGEIYHFKNNSSNLGLLVSGNHITVVNGDSIFTSHDLGVSWQQTPTSNWFQSTGSFYVWSGTSDKIYCSVGNNIYQSLDFGQHWDIICSFDQPYDFDYVQPIISEDFYLVSNRHRLYRSTNNGQNWSSSELGCYAHVVWDLEVGYEALYGLYGYGIFSTLDEGISWNNVYTSNYWGDIHGLKAFGSELYFYLYKPFSNPPYQLFYSNDFGNSLNIQSINMIGSNVVKTSNHEYLFINDSLNISVFNGGQLSKNILVPDYLKSQYLNFHYLNQRAFIFGPDILNNISILYSDDDGFTWAEGIEFPDLTSVVLDNIDNTLIISGHDKIYISNDSGLNWEEGYIHPNLSINLRLEGFCKKDSRWYAFSGAEGIFYSEDDGRNWYPWTPIANQYIYHNALTSLNNKLYLSPGGAGVWYFDQTTNIPKLSQNNHEIMDLKVFPNPAFNDLKIQFICEESKEVDLSLSDFSGISTFKKQFMVHPGENIIDLKIPYESANPGLYYLQIISGTKMISQQKIVISH